MISSSVITRNVNEMVKDTGNIYESMAIISKRSKQLAVKEKEELSAKLAEFASTVDNLEEIFENREQIEISRFYEKQPKSTNVATEEFMEGKLMYRKREDTAEIPEL
ncbi:MAG: DNA-directed RNA polymerase subunit omega [Cyclobacteriaceae bacterium]|nr:DNA-directed RNA polymerase subunit omega [Cyclobacteriaceae bacterium]